MPPGLPLNSIPLFIIARRNYCTTGLAIAGKRRRGVLERVEAGRDGRALVGMIALWSGLVKMRKFENIP
jgi:hypothetical protein